MLLASCPVCVYSAPVTMAFVARMMRRGVTARSVQRLAAPSFREYIISRTYEHTVGVGL